MGNAEVQTQASNEVGPVMAAVKMWLSAYRVELLLFVGCFAVLSGFSSQRFLRQSAAPHFIYQAQAWLEGRVDVDAQVLPNLEDWACVREVSGAKVRCEGALMPTDKWYVSFPAFPAVLMLPFVAINGYQFNDTSFGVIIGALAIAFFYSLLKQLKLNGGSTRSENENIILALTLGFGTVFFYCSIRGEVWFFAEVLGVLLTCLYARFALGARSPVWAGVFFSMAVLTRTPLLFSGVFFVMEALCPTPGQRWKDFQTGLKGPGLKKLMWFAAGAAPLAIAHAAFNAMRFGSITEFGHRFFYNNRVNVDIDTFGLFHPHYLARNIDAAFLTMPQLRDGMLSYSPWGLSLLLTLPWLPFIFLSPERRRPAWVVLAIEAGLLLLCWFSPELPPAPGQFPIGNRASWVWMAALILFGALWVEYSQKVKRAPLMTPLVVTALCCAIPGFFYQNTGFAQFGFRFSLDYTPYLLAALAVTAWSLRHLSVALGLGFLVNFWGAIGFRGYTELMRGW